LKAKLAEVIKTKSRAEWCAIMDATDVCFAPVLDLTETAAHPHNAARQTFVEIEGVVQPAPAPRFSATPGAIQFVSPPVGAHNEEAFADWGFSPGDIEALKTASAL